MTQLTNLFLGLFMITAPVLAQPEQDQSEFAQLPVEEPRVEIFDIADIVGDRAKRRAGWEDLDADARLAELHERAQALAELLSEFIQPPLIEGREDIEALGSTNLVARVRLAQREWLQDRLLHFRLREIRVIETEWRSMHLEAEAAAGLGLEMGLTVVDDPRALIMRLQEARADVLHAPKVTTYDGQRYSISMLNEVAVVRDYQVYENVSPSGQRVIDPVVEVIPDGIIIEGQALILGEDVIGLSFEMTRSELEQPIEAIHTPHGPIAKPTVRRAKTESSCALSSGQSLVIVGRDSEDRVTVQILRVTLID